MKSRGNQQQGRAGEGGSTSDVLRVAVSMSSTRMGMTRSLRNSLSLFVSCQRGGGSVVQTRGKGEREVFPGEAEAGQREGGNTHRAR